MIVEYILIALGSFALGVGLIVWAIYVYPVKKFAEGL